ncbi:MAG: YfcE family phosphodiesterase [Dehalococcoidia bacterium]|nr:YfcE family phosphodiesterase [Dehalococcoidia bacterium]
MKIGLISDTHIPSMGKEPPHQVVRAFEGVELILHAGDIYTHSCIEWLERIAPVRSSSSWASSLREAAPRNSQPITVEAGGHTIGLVHELIMSSLGDDFLPGIMARRFPANESIPAALSTIFDKPVDIVVFGYTHEPLVETHQGVLFINPGSTSMLKQVMKLGSVAILELTPQGREARIIQLAEVPE